MSETVRLFCRIRVKGQLNPSWFDRLGGMRISTLHGPSGPETRLEGQLPDQASLQGAITAFGELNLAVVSVETMDLE